MNQNITFELWNLQCTSSNLSPLAIMGLDILEVVESHQGTPLKNK